VTYFSSLTFRLQLFFVAMLTTFVPYGPLAAHPGIDADRPAS
jgi:hypothetical protein